MNPRRNNNNNTNGQDQFNLTTGGRQPTIKTEDRSTNQSPTAFTELSPTGTMTEEELVAMGIDINEIRAQRDIEKRLYEEARQQEYAEQLQAEFNRELAGLPHTQASSSSTTTSSLPRSTTTVTTTATTNSSSITNSSGTTRLASVTRSTSGNQPGRNLATSNIITIADDDDDNDDDDDDDNNNTSSLSHRPRSSFITNSKKRESSTSSSPPQHKKRRRNRIWVFAGESISDIEDDNYDMFPRSNRHPMNNANNNNMSGPSNTSSGLSTTASSSTTSRIEQSRKPLTATAKGKAVATKEEIQSLMDGGPDNVDGVAPTIPRNALADLDVTLMDHQQVGFKWMYQQEISRNKGGMLCDDMGLGKTIQSLAIMVARRSTNHDSLPVKNASNSQSNKRIKAKTTMIVCPVNLMTQWAKEISSKTKSLSVHVNHGKTRTSDPNILASFDVVITSYHTLASEYSNSNEYLFRNSLPQRTNYIGMYKVIYYRIILDEAHMIKNSSSLFSRSCDALHGIHRWCLTATPIQNKIDDMFGLVQFLQISPYNDYNLFKQKIVLPLASKDSSEKENGKKLFKSFALRRSKNLVSGAQPVIKLPERTVHVTYVDFTANERKAYDIVNEKILKDIGFTGRNTIIMQRHTTMLGYVLSLRQACLHPGLIDYSQHGAIQTTKSSQTNSAKHLTSSVVKRLMNIKNELVFTECSICMDVADQPQIISGCGHILCAVCLNNYIHSSSCFYNGRKSCPECRGALQPDKVVPVDAFLKVHDPSFARPSPSVKSIKMPEIPSAIGSSKIKTMLNILETTRLESDGQDKTIIFSNFTKLLDTTARALNVMKIPHLRYDGTVTVPKRGRILSDFESNPSLRVLLISTKSGAVGLNLTMANRVIFIDVGCNPMMDAQAIGRVHRIGQTKPVEVHHLVVRNSVEERLMALQAKKQEMSAGALDGGSRSSAETFTKMGKDEWLYLLGNIPLPGSSVTGPSRSRSRAR